MVQKIGVDLTAGVGDAHANELRLWREMKDFTLSQRQRPVFARQGQRAAALSHRVRRMDTQVKDCLLEMSAVAGNGRQFDLQLLLERNS